MEKENKKRRRFTDEELIQWASQFDTLQQAREADETLLCIMYKRKLKDHLPKKSAPGPASPTRLLWSPKYDSNGDKICPRCNIRHDMRIPLCRDCRNEVARLQNKGQWTNLGNVKDTFCHTKITFDDGEELTIEYNLEYEDIQKVLKNGYGFILIPRHMKKNEDE